MKRYFVLLILVLSALSWAQVEWQADGIPVRQGVNIEWFRSGFGLESGGCVYTWSDTRYGDRDVFAQRIGENGELLWGAQSVLINGEINRQEDIVVINGSGDETIYAWIEFRHEDAGDVYAQKLDGDGNIMWAEEGVPLCLDAGTLQISLNIVSDGNGGAFIIWQDQRNAGGFDIYGTHLLADGTIADGWDTDGSPIIQMEGNQTGHTFWEDGEGGAIVAWYDQRNDSDHNIYMQRIASDGTLMWGADGVQLTYGALIQDSPKITPDATGNFIIAWRDKQNDGFGDIYCNRVDLDGNILWAQDVIVYEGNGIQRNPRVTEASDGGAFITWEDGRNHYEFKDIYAQKISTDGTLQWDADGVVVSDQENNQLNPRLVGDDDGGCWIVWDDGWNGGYPQVDIFLQHFDADGNGLLGEDGMNLCDAGGYQFSPLIKKDGNGQIYLSWGDDRDGSTGLYVQMVDESGNELLTNNGELVYYGLCGDALNFQLFGTGDKQVLFWEDTRFSTIASQIYMQVMNEDGSFDLIEDGIPITEMTGYNQSIFDIVNYDDEFAVGWVELRGIENKVYAQKVDDEGIRFWGDSGISLSERESVQEDIKVSYDDGAYYFGWSDRFGFMEPVNQVCAQKVVNGELQWGPEGVSVADLPFDDLMQDVVGRYFIWVLNAWPDVNLYANYLTEDGEPAAGWGEDGILVCDAPYNQQLAQGVQTDEGLLVIWEDQRNSLPDSANADIYGQLISESGEIQWEANGKALIELENDQVDFQIEYRDGYFYLVWKDLRAGDYDIYMEKFDMNGDSQWGENGIGVAVKPLEQANPSFTFFENSILVYWDDLDQGNDQNIFVKMYNLEGEEIGGFPSDGLRICEAIKNQSRPTAVVDDEGYSYVIWSDFRSSGKTDIYNIYAQKMENFTAAEDFEIEDDFKIGMANYPNPFRSGTKLTFNISRDYLENAEVNIYNMKGQKVRSLPLERSSVYWDGKDSNGKLTSSGIYMYRLKNGEFESQAEKMIRLK